VRGLLADHGFTVGDFREAAIRMEGGLPVAGWLIVARSCAAARPPLI